MLSTIEIKPSLSSYAIPRSTLCPNHQLTWPTFSPNPLLYSRSNIGLVAISSHSSGGSVTFVSHVSSGKSAEGRSSSPSLFNRPRMLYADDVEAEGLLGPVVAIGSPVTSLRSLSLPLSLLESRSSTGLWVGAFVPAPDELPCKPLASLRCCSRCSFLSLCSFP